MYSNLPKGELKAVFCMDGLSKGMCWYPASKVQGDEICGSIQFRKDVFYFWHGPCEFSCYFIESSVIYLTNVFLHHLLVPL